MATQAMPLSLDVDLEVQVDAPPERVFESLLHILSDGMTTPDGTSMNMRLEARPGGRWWRDLGGDQGHFWGHVQVVKRPGLLELVGPMFMSYAALSHLQFRVVREGGITTLSLRHQAIGAVQAEHAEGVSTGWRHMLEGVRSHAESR